MPECGSLHGRRDEFMENDDKPHEQKIQEISAEARITIPQPPQTRILGSHPSGLRLLRRREPDGFPEPDGLPEPEPQPPPPAVSTPDLAFQFSPCLPDFLRTRVVDAVRQAIDPEADVRAACLEGTERIGIWLRPLPSEADSQARDQGLERLGVIRSGESLAVFINSALIRRSAQENWNATPKRLDGNGRPDSNGPIHLTGMSISFQSPNRVVTRVSGFDERPWPDVDFELVVTETLSISGGEVQCQSESDLDVDTTWLHVLTGLFTGLGALVSPWFFLGAAIFVVQNIIIAGVDAPDTGTGAGCGAAQLVPREIMFEGDQKAVFDYDRVNISSGGIFAGGLYMVIDREPEVLVSGPRQLSVDFRANSVRRVYGIQPDDLRGALRVRWTADGTVANPTSRSTAIDFDLSEAGPGSVQTRRVEVNVTDEDNLVAVNEALVRIHVTDLLEEDLPPVCRVKPWLPQCQGFGRP